MDLKSNKTSAKNIRKLETAEVAQLVCAHVSVCSRWWRAWRIPGWTRRYGGWSCTSLWASLPLVCCFCWPSPRCLLWPTLSTGGSSASYKYANARGQVAVRSKEAALYVKCSAGGKHESTTTAWRLTGMSLQIPRRRVVHVCVYCAAAPDVLLNWDCDKDIRSVVTRCSHTLCVLPPFLLVSYDITRKRCHWLVLLMIILMELILATMTPFRCYAWKFVKICKYVDFCRKQNGFCEILTRKIFIGMHIVVS